MFRSSAEMSQPSMDPFIHSHFHTFDGKNNCTSSRSKYLNILQGAYVYVYALVYMSQLPRDFFHRLYSWQKSEIKCMALNM